jgi:hypothetical protein
VSVLCLEKYVTVIVYLLYDDDLKRQAQRFLSPRFAICRLCFLEKLQLPNLPSIVAGWPIEPDWCLGMFCALGFLCSIQEKLF